jgi:hypothetical protein
VKGILPANHSFQGGQRFILLLIGLFSCAEETHVSVQRQPSVLEELACRTLFPSELN